MIADERRKMWLIFLGGMRRAVATLLPALLVLLLYPVPPSSHGEQKPVSRGLPANELLRLGERMYREGVLPSGKPMNAVVAGDIPVEGTMFSCISCHLRSGFGSYEGTVYSPPVSGRRLFMAFGKVEEPVTADDLLMIPYWLRPTIRRMPYTDKTLGQAIREGIDYAGRELNNVMPRYLLDDDDLGTLIHYLKGLSNEISPGVTDTELRFSASTSLEYFGNMPMVNGVTYGKYDVEPRIYRMRFIGGTDSRTWILRLEDRANPGVAIPFWQVGSEQGLLPNPVSRTQMDLMPGRAS